MEDSNEPFSLSLLLKKAGITEESKLKKLEFFLNYSEVTENLLSQVTEERLKEWEKEFKAELREDESLKKEFYEFVGKEVRFVLGATAGAIAKAASEWGKKEFQQPKKRLKITENESPFLYGEQNFMQFGQGTFFRDNTYFISLMESLNQKAIVSLHPRRFGKSLFVSILNEYYDLKNKNRLNELLGGCWIVKNLTLGASSFLVLPLDFSNLDTTDFVHFEENFKAKNNRKLNTFLTKYNTELGISVFDDKSDFVVNFGAVCDLIMLRGFKMYVTIDEYDSSLMNSLSNQLLTGSMRINKDKDSKQEDSKKIENQFKRFFSSLKEANKGHVYAFITGISPLCLNEFTSGWNHATCISDYEEFAEMYGLVAEDVAKGIEMIKPPIPKDVQQMLINYCDRFDGYIFHPLQNVRLYNPGRIVYFLQQVRLKWLSQSQFSKNNLFQSLVNFIQDSQTRPAESTLKYIQTSKASKLLLQDLLQEENAEVKCEEGVDPRFSLEKILVDRRSLISFMFYTGALTYAGNCLFRIPNLDAKIDFIEAAVSLLEIDGSLYAQIKKGIEYMLEKEDISNLCSSFAFGSEKERGVRDTIQGEVTFQEVVFNRLLVCRNPLDKVNSEYVVKKAERESNQQTNKKTIDIVYTDHEGHRRFCFELKNIRVQDLECGKLYLDNYDKLKKISDTIVEMDSRNVLKLNLKPQNECPQWFQSDWAPTVEEFMVKSCKQVASKYQAELQKDDIKMGKSLAWVVVRVGLGKIFNQKAF